MKENSPHRILAETLLDNLSRTYRTIKWRDSVTQVLLFLAIFFTGVVILMAFEEANYLPAWIKSAFLALTLVCAVSIAWWLHYDRKSAGFTRFYRSFCQNFGYTDIGNALDLYVDNSAGKTSLYDLAIIKNLEGFRENAWKKDLKSCIQTRKEHRSYQLGIASFSISLLLLGSMGYSDPGLLNRSLVFWETAVKPNPYQYAVTPGNVTLEQGSGFAPVVEFLSNRVPQQVTLAFKTDVEDEYRFRPMNRTDQTQFSSRSVEMTNNGSYYVLMDEFQSNVYGIDIHMPPRFESLSATVIPPGYTNLDSTQHTYPFAQIRVLEGSVIELKGRVNKPVNGVDVISADSVTSMTAASAGEPLDYRLALNVDRTDTLLFTMRDRDDLSNDNPYRFVLNMLQDEYPSITIREPSGNLQVSNPVSLDLIYSASDDFGLTDAQLNWELTRAFASEPVQGSESLTVPEIGSAEFYEWDLADLELRPRDKLEFRVTVRDNDSLNGYKSTSSQPLLLEVPSMSATMDELDSREQSIRDSLTTVSESFQQFEEEFDRFREQLRENPDPDWEEEEMLENIQEQQSDIEESVRQMNEQFQEIRRQMESSDMVSDETRQAYGELQELMEDLDDPELRRALEELRNSMQNLNPELLQQALEDFEFNEQVYKERLERTLDLFKTLKMNSDLDKLAQQYDDMANRMEGNDGEELSPGEQRESRQAIREDTDHVENQLENLDNNPPQRNREQIQNLQRESLDELDNIQEQLDELIENSGENDPVQESNGENQQEISNTMRERSESIRQSMQQMNGNQIQINILALQRSLYTLLELSESQEELTVRSGQINSRSQGYVEMARLQNNINNLFSQVADSLTRIASEIPTMSNTISSKKLEVEQILTRTRNQMAEREQRTAVITSRESLGGINDLASMIASAIDQLMDQQNGQGGGGLSMQQMIEQMQTMSLDQQMMNEQLQELINDIQGERLTVGQSERLEQLTRQQNEIRKQLEQLRQSGALRQGDGTLSEIQRMLDGMEDAINDMRGGMTDPAMVERQQNILSRMLAAEESLQQRGQEEDEYEGRQSETLQRSIPPDITIEELRQEIRTRLQDPEYTRFSNSYQLLIERYFELLGRYENGPLP